MGPQALVVDAEDLRGDALEGELRRQGYEVRRARDGEGALTAARAGGLVVAAIALRVGEEDGRSLVRGLQERMEDEEATVILVAEPGELSIREAVEAGAADVWHLPADAPGALETRISLAQHYARLQAENLRVGGEFALLRRALDLTGTGFVLTDPRLEDDPIVYANQSFYDLTGYLPEEVLGRNCRFLQGEGTDPERVAYLRERLQAERPVTVEFLNYRRDGTPFHNEVHVSPVRDASGAVVRFVGVQLDVSAYREQQRRFAREQSARTAAEAAERRSAFLAGASPLLDASLDLRTTLDSLVRLCVPFLGEICLVDEVADGEVRRLAAAAADPGVERLVRLLPGRYAADAGDTEAPVARALRTGRSELVSEAATALPGPEAAPAEGLRARAAMVVPLRARGRAIGALTIASLRPGRHYDAGDLGLAEDLARRAALALDNARLHESQTRIARTLQSGMLPGRLPELPGVELAARYRPGGDGMVIGGDFYDILPREGGFDLVIGDVTGKGAGAAALTGLVRHTLRTAARYESSPSAILRVVNEALLADQGPTGRYCTVALCRVDLGERPRARICAAGHPHPLVLREGGAVEPVGESGALLGWVADPRLTDADVELGGAETVLLYTDGLSEAPAGTARFGEARVAEVLHGAAGESAGTVAARLEAAAFGDEAPRDDVALLVARLVTRAGSA